MACILTSTALLCLSFERGGGFGEGAFSFTLAGPWFLSKWLSPMCQPCEGPDRCPLLCWYSLVCDRGCNPHERAFADDVDSVASLLDVCPRAAHPSCPSPLHSPPRPLPLLFKVANLFTVSFPSLSQIAGFIR